MTNTFTPDELAALGDHWKKGTVLFSRKKATLYLGGKSYL